jgi:ABC-type uncharacterized transport system permease subunit
MTNPVSEVLDLMMLNFIRMYYWPYFVAGNMDDWIAVASLNGFKGNICKPR